MWEVQIALCNATLYPKERLQFYTLLFYKLPHPYTTACFAFCSTSIYGLNAPKCVTRSVCKEYIPDLLSVRI